MLLSKKYCLLLSALIVFSCANAQPPSGKANVGDQYGAPFTEGDNTDLKKLDTLSTGAELTGYFEGEALEVCPKKGCWIKIKLDNGEEAFVKMKDYGFFVPLAVEGKRIRIKGDLVKTITSVNELRHYAEDAHQTQEEINKITQPKQELRITACSIKVVES